MSWKRSLVEALWAILPSSTSVTIGGKRASIPLQRGFDRRLLSPQREPWLDSLLRELCWGADSVLIDVGANCGQTLLKAKTINPTLRYVGFEPNPACAGYLQQLISLNQWRACQVYSCALGARCEI